MEKSRGFERIFISPHFDDVVFSCGGLLAQLRGISSVLVITVFSGVGEGFSSKTGKKFILDCGYESGEELFNRRKMEEKKVAIMLEYKTQLMNFPDAIFRYEKGFLGKKHFYNDSAHLFGEVNKNDKVMGVLEKELNELINKYSKRETMIYFPLGLGGHVDHKIVSFIGKNLKWRKIYYYEDFPYVTYDKGISLDGMKLKIVLTPKKILKEKYQAMLEYKSQINDTFRSNNNLRKQLNDFYLKRGEYYWQTK